MVTVGGKRPATPNATMVDTAAASYTTFPNLRLDVEATIGVTDGL